MKQHTIYGRNIITSIGEAMQDLLGSLRVLLIVGDGPGAAGVHLPRVPVGPPAGKLGRQPGFLGAKPRTQGGWKCSRGSGSSRGNTCTCTSTWCRWGIEPGGRRRPPVPVVVAAVMAPVLVMVVALVVVGGYWGNGGKVGSGCWGWRHCTVEAKGYTKWGKRWELWGFVIEW